MFIAKECKFEIYVFMELCEYSNPFYGNDYTKQILRRDACIKIH